QEEVLAVARHPRSDAELGISIARGRVDVIDAVAQQHLEGAVGIVLARARERRRAEQHHAALMTGAAERSPLERRARHGITKPPVPTPARASCEERLTMRPYLRSIIAGSAARVQSMVPVTLIASIRA